MEKTEFKKQISDLYKEYLEAIDNHNAENKKAIKDGKMLDVGPTFDGFMRWVETGKVK